MKRSAIVRGGVRRGFKEGHAFNNRPEPIQATCGLSNAPAYPSPKFAAQISTLPQGEG